MMKKLIATGLSFLLVFPAVAEEVDRTLEAAADGHVDISNIAGAVTVSGWTRNEVEVTGTLGRNVEELIFERNKDKITVKVKVPRRGGRGIDSDLHINVPQQSSIDVSGVSADIDVTEVMGEQRLHTVSGDISTESAGSDVTAESVSGDVEIEGDKSATETKASTVSGDLTLFRVSGTVIAESVTGRIVIDEGSFSRVNLTVVNGELMFQAGLEKGGKLSAETVNGAVDVEFVGDLSAKIDVGTVNGRIRNCFGPEAERTSKYAPGWSLRFTEGDGDGRVEISTVNGGVNLCRK